MVKPPFKWTGGKYNHPVCEYLKLAYNTMTHPYYVTLFAGGLGDVFRVEPQTIIANDSNLQLIYLWDEIRKQHPLLIHQVNNQYEWETLRNEYNDYKDTLPLPSVLYSLLKQGFNGLYRENSKGKFNVPLGKNSKGEINKVTPIPEEVYSFFKDKTCFLWSSDYREVLELNSDHNLRSLYYFDPPYFDCEVTYGQPFNGFECGEHFKSLPYAIATNNMCEDTAKAYQGCYYLPVNYTQNMGRSKKVEVIIFTKGLVDLLHLETRLPDSLLKF